MLPAYWGKPGWIFLFAVALNYPINPTNQDKENYKTFFLLLQYVLPCQDCSNHFSHNLSLNPLNDTVLSSRMNLVNWLIRMKNIVNKQTGKKEIPIDKALQIVLNRSGSSLTSHEYSSSEVKKKNFYWEESAWIFLHGVTIEYPVKPIELDKEKHISFEMTKVKQVSLEMNKEKYRLFFLSLANTMPDLTYQNYYKQALRQFPLSDEILSSQTNLVNWGNEIHNFLDKQYGISPVSSKTRIMKILMDHDKVVDNQKIIMKEINKEISYSNLLFLILIIVLIIIISIIGCCCITN